MFLIYPLILGGSPRPPPSVLQVTQAVEREEWFTRVIEGAGDTEMGLVSMLGACLGGV